MTTHAYASTVCRGSVEILTSWAECGAISCERTKKIGYAEAKGSTIMPNSIKKGGFSSAAMALLCIICGCQSDKTVEPFGGLHLHNAGDESLARKAQSDFTAADVGGYVAKQRAVVQADNDRDLTAVRQNMSSLQAQWVIYALDKDTTAGKFMAQIDQRQKLIGLPNGPSQTDYFLQSQLEDVRLSEAILLATAFQLGKPFPIPSIPPSEDDVNRVARLNDPQLNSNFAQFSRSATAYSDALRKENSEFGLNPGALRDASNEINQATVIQASIKQLNDSAAKELTDAVDAYKKAAKVNNADSDLRGASQKIQTALKDFDKYINQVKPLADKAGLSDLVAMLKLTKIKAGNDQIATYFDGFSNELAGKSSPGKGSSTETAGRAAAILLNLSDSIQIASNQEKLVPLAFQKERLTIEANRLQHQIDRGNARISLLERKQKLLVKESMRLRFARAQLSGLPGAESFAAGAHKEEFLGAIMTFAESIGLERRQEEECNLSLVALDHDEAMDATEYALDLWQATVQAPLQQLVNYHASGLTTEDFAQLVQAASLAAIGVGTNR